MLKQKNKEEIVDSILDLCKKKGKKFVKQKVNERRKLAWWARGYLHVRINHGGALVRFLKVLNE